MSLHLPRVDGIIQLERTGPYIPPITFPGASDVVVTDAVKRQFERRLPALHFLPLLIKKHIVRLDWQNWDPTAQPALRPITGEPEDYILRNPHDDRAANKLGILWELAAEIDPGIQGKTAYSTKNTTAVSTSCEPPSWPAATLSPANCVPLLRPSYRNG